MTYDGKEILVGSWLDAMREDWELAVGARLMRWIRPDHHKVRDANAIHFFARSFPQRTLFSYALGNICKY
jgi:hypothetical protein